MAKFMKTIKVDLSKGEADRLLEQLDQAYGELLAVKAEKAEVNQDLNKRMKDSRKTMREIHNARTTKQREITIECEERYNPKSKLVETIRCDTGKVVDTRQPTAEEVQMGLSFSPEGSNGHSKPKAKRAKKAPDAEAEA